jgi:sodium/proline symporter
VASANPFIRPSFLLYLAGMLAIGWIYYGRTKNLPDYVLGGRRLNTWVAAMSAQASDMSGWLLLGLPGYAYLAGLESIWIAVGLIVGTYMNWRFVAKRLRKYTEIAGDSITLSDYLENRFNDRSKALRIVSALFILVFFLIYTSSGFVAGAKLFSTVFGISYVTALVIGVLVIISYTFLGGFMAVSWTDFFQGTIMFLAIVTVPLLGLRGAGGFGSAVAAIREGNQQFLDSLTAVDGASLSAVAVISLLAWGLGYFGQPHILARFMAIRTSAQITRARQIAMTWVIISLACAVAVGLVGRAYLGDALVDGTSETVFMVMVDAVVPPLLAGFLLAAILAAIMSTADSQLLVTSSALSEDFYRVLFRKRASDRELVWIGRLSVVCVAIIAFLIAMDPKSSVLSLVAYAWGGFGATFGPIMILSLFWKRMTRNGALAGLITGGLTVLIWKQLSGGLFDLYEIVPGFVLSVVVITLVSLLGKEPDRAVKEQFERVGISEI